MPKDGKLKNGLYKRGDYYYLDVCIEGTRYRKAVGPDRRRADLVLAELKKQRALGKATQDWSGLDQLTRPKNSRLFEEVANEYIAERPGLKPSTLRGYREVLKNYLIPEFGSMPVDRITEDLIARFQARVGMSVSAVRTNNIMGLLRYILKVCVRRKLIAENPASNIRPLAETAPTIDPLTMEELERVLAFIHPHYRPLFITLAFTGARPNELLALRWQDVDFKRKEMHVRKGRVRGHEGLPKTSSSQRTIPMLPLIVETLEEIKPKPKPSMEGYVFLSKKGTPFNKHMDRQWRVALQKAGVKHRPSYQLRHTFASYCCQQGCDPAWLARILGHTTMQTTFRHYLRFIQDASKENERRLELSLTRRPMKIQFEQTLPTVR